jgi:NAD(P)-dependent dehydrogenase (short-subunit alcohol dehydrogenase family)
VSARHGAVLLTGASGAIGSAVLALLVASDRPVVAVSRRGVDAYAGVEDLRADLLESAGLELVVRRAGSADIDAVVNVAGITGPRVPAWDASAEDWERMSAINVRPVIEVCRAASSAWIAREWAGSIVNMSSPGAVRAHRHRAVYDASRAAVEAYTRALAVDLGPHGIRANAIRPAAVGLSAPEAPMGRGASAPEVAEAMVALLDASAVTGVALDIDGGLLAQLRPAADDRRHELGGVR